MSVLSAVEVVTPINPATEEALAPYPVATRQQVLEATAAARRVQGQWSSASLAKRARILSDVADKLLEEADSFAHCITTEMGKPFREALEADLFSAISTTRYMAAIGPRVLRDKPYHSLKSLLLGRLHAEHRVPHGVVGIISPWNYPLGTPASGISMALMAGNAVILKPSEITPGTAELLVRLYQSVLSQHGFPKAIVQVLHGDGRVGAALCEAPEVDYLLFTGSSATGQRVQQAMQARGKSVNLELGGSDPMILLESCPDWDAALSTAVWARFTNAGQTCAAIKRLLVPESRYEEVLKVLEEKISGLRVGDPMNPENHMGPLASELQLQRLMSQVSDAVNSGARIISGGYRLNRPGFFYAPTVLADVPADASVLGEEVFGPALIVIAYKTIKQAVEIANALPYGLTASVFGSEKEAGIIARQLEAGTVAINDVAVTNYAQPVIPWNGHKASGPGIRHGKAGLLEMTRLRVMTENLSFKLPGLRKAPWLFCQKASEDDNSLSWALLKAFTTESLREKLSLSLLRALLQRSLKKKI
jgi:succinate-semialdehyde dehydrogenase/glutarate-semialdehyde dehydrogenase